jgi:hypothetical protein
MMTYSIRREALGDGHVHVVTLSGEARHDELLSLVAELDGLAQQQPSLRVLVDERAVKASFITPPALRDIAHAWMAAAALKRARVAIFAPTPLIYGLNRMVQVFGRADKDMSVFRDRAAALSWLESPTE